MAKKVTSEFRLTGRKTIVFHAGDFDPDGVVLSEHIARDVHAFLSDLLPYGADPAEVLVFKRIMLLEHQVPEDRKAPFDRSKVKKNDHRGQRWPHAWKADLEAVPLELQLQILEGELRRVLDLDQLRRDHETSAAELAEILATFIEISANEEPDEEQ